MHRVDISGNLYDDCYVCSSLLLTACDAVAFVWKVLFGAWVTRLMVDVIHTPQQWIVTLFGWVLIMLFEPKLCGTRLFYAYVAT